MRGQSHPFSRPENRELPLRGNGMEEHHRTEICHNRHTFSDRHGKPHSRHGQGTTLTSRKARQVVSVAAAWYLYVRRNYVVKTIGVPLILFGQKRKLVLVETDLFSEFVVCCKISPVMLVFFFSCHVFGFFIHFVANGPDHFNGVIRRNCRLTLSHGYPSPWSHLVGRRSGMFASPEPHRFSRILPPFRPVRQNTQAGNRENFSRIFLYRSRLSASITVNGMKTSRNNSRAELTMGN